MKQKNFYIILFFCQLYLTSCCFCDEEIIIVQEEKPILTFVVAGHVSGNPDSSYVSIYPPFLEKIKLDHQERNFNFLFLTGDVVTESTDSIWNRISKELDGLNIAWFIAPGNHDLGLSRVPLSKKMQQDHGMMGPYYHVSENENQFFVLNTSNPGWTIDSMQLAFFENQISHTNSTDNIFVFSHQLWWQKNRPKEFDLDSVRTNSFSLLDGPSDFWKDAFPMFDSLENQVYFFAGDLGSDVKLESYYEDHHKNFHFYGSGMGGGLSDNYLVVSVYQNGVVEIERVDF